MGQSLGHDGLQSQFSQVYLISVLKRTGVKVTDLVRHYSTVIRPSLEYAVNAWHSGFTYQQLDLIERVQSHVLRIILPDASYREALAVTGLRQCATDATNFA